MRRVATDGGSGAEAERSDAPDARSKRPQQRYVVGMPRYYWIFGVVAIALLGLALRLHGIHNPLLDHPGWRQGDTGAIARNFARLQFDIMRPQTMYDGPPPNYVELELQIVPFIAAILYKIFGIHEVFGRLVSIAFSLGTVVALAYFGRWLFTSAIAGLLAGFFYAVFPGSVYYGRTFMPDAAMVFFLTAALYACARYLIESTRILTRGLALSTVLLTLAYLAKPVAVLALAPLGGMLWQRLRRRRALPLVSGGILIVVPLLVLWLYDRRVAAYAEWHWASGITRLHVMPALMTAFEHAGAFAAKASQFAAALGMLPDTMLGRIAFAITIASLVALPWIDARSKALLWGWLVGGLVYAYVVVTVERVDYYLYPLLPLCALVMGGALARYLGGVSRADAAPPARYALMILVPAIAIAVLAQSRSAVAAYYRYDKQVYRNAVALNADLSKDAIVVIGHYGPNVQYYIDRFGWEEDPAVWTPYDEESAIRKGARYFISIEDRRMRANRDLCVWLQRFPLQAGVEPWPIYRTDPALASSGGDALWRAFRRAERAGAGAAFLQRRGLCGLTTRSP
ncbi:MAG: glycosyltransferase family 39 protein [Candidatus Eremiobacteraeota bacterium]|nr:glycosyltransferase family 39 protein [Candidatus Eremiobacteraeota bacterium]